MATASDPGAHARCAPSGARAPLSSTRFFAAQVFWTGARGGRSVTKMHGAQGPLGLARITAGPSASRLCTGRPPAASLDARNRGSRRRRFSWSCCFSSHVLLLAATVVSVSPIDRIVLIFDSYIMIHPFKDSTSPRREVHATRKRLRTRPLHTTSTCGNMVPATHGRRPRHIRSSRRRRGPTTRADHRARREIVRSGCRRPENKSLNFTDLNETQGSY